MPCIFLSPDRDDILVAKRKDKGESRLSV